MPLNPAPSPDRYRLYFDRAPVAFATVTGDGEMEAVNLKFTADFGYLPEDLPNMERWWELAYPDPDYRGAVRETWAAAVRRSADTGNEVIAGEFSVRRKDGTSGIYLVGANIVDGSVLASFLDITERKRVEKALEESLEKFRALTEVANTGIWQVDKDGRTIYANPTMCRILGCANPEDVGERRFRSFFEGESRETAKQAYRDRAAGLTTSYEATLTALDGTKHDLYVSGVPFQDGEGRFLGTIATFMDITGRKRAEAALRRSEEALRAVLDAAPYSIAINSALDGRFLGGNSSLLESLGLKDLSELIGRRVSDFVTLGRVDEEIEMLKAMREGRVVDRIQSQTVDRRGRRKIFLISARPFEHKDEPAFVTILVDITPLKQAEERLRVLNADLERKVAERTEDLERANRELKAANDGLARAMDYLQAAQGKIIISEKLAALGRLVAGIAHELNTPLAAIASSSRTELKNLGEGLDEMALAVSRLGPGDMELVREARSRIVRQPILSPLDPCAERRARKEAQDFLEAAGIRDAGAIAEDLVELGIPDMAGKVASRLSGSNGSDLMDVLRGTLGAYRAACVAQDAVEKAERVVSALRTYARGGEDEAPVLLRVAPEMRGLLALFGSRTNRGIQIALDIPEDLEIYGKREALNRVWFNILNNAVQAVGEKGRIEVRASREDGISGAVLVSVTDSGPGISEAIRERIFEPFFTTLPAGEGTGLGLDIARRLAREHGGEITFKSRPGRTVFTVRLPRGTASPEGDDLGNG